MISRTRWVQAEEPTDNPRGFDDFELRLGDMMRGERATLGKSLLDVQRELRIKASYIAAIENCDPSAFDTPGFIAGYVRSYARYLGMDPDETFAAFCAESGFSVAHGMSEQASVVKRARPESPVPTSAGSEARDPFTQPRLPFTPHTDSVFSRIEPGAIGSLAVLVALIGGIGYGGWTVLQEVQRVQITPVDQTPIVLSELDPVQVTRPSGEAAANAAGDASGGGASAAGVFTPPSNEALDRLYRPQALDVPVLVARDAPISTLDPSRVGTFARAPQSDLPEVQPAATAAQQVERQLAAAVPAPDRIAGPAGNGVTVIAVRPAWVRVTGADGTLYEGIMNGGDTYQVPGDATAPRIQVGESGAVYFAVDGRTVGPAGARGQVTSGIELAAAALNDRFQPAETGGDADLARVLADLAPSAPPVADAAAPVVAEAGPAPAPVLDPANADEVDAAGATVQTAAAEEETGEAAQPGRPQVVAAGAPGVTIVATGEAWVRVRDASGTTLYESVMRPGDTWSVPRTEQAPTIRTGNAGAVYFAVNGQTYGPYGGAGAIADDLALSVAGVTSQMTQADPAQNAALAKVVAELAPEPATPQQPATAE